MAAGATIGTGTYGSSYRAKYISNTLQISLRNALVAEKVCAVDRTDLKYIHNPYGNQPTASVQALAGTYTVSSVTVTDDTLTVTDEFIYAEHIYDFDIVLSRFDLWASRIDEMNASVATAIDKWVVNELCENGSGTYTTPAGGFTTAANINVIMSNLLSKVTGYADTYKGLFLIIENTDVPGFIQAQASNGFSFADAALKNGFMTSYMGVDIYVVRSGTFVDATTTSVSGSKTWTNDNHRVFGVKGVATYAAPRGIKVEEKMVTATTGVEVAVFGYCGFKLWNSKTGLVVDISLA